MLNNKKKFFALVLIISVIVLDQATKFLILENLVDYQSIKILPIFNIVLIYNTGAAFGFMSTMGGWQNYFFIAIAFVVCIYIFYLIYQSQKKIEVLSFSLIVGGAIANVVDRIRIGKVVDFLDFHIGEHHFPAFNVADSAITIGVMLMIVAIIFSPKTTNV